MYCGGRSAIALLKNLLKLKNRAFPDDQSLESVASWDYTSTVIPIMETTILIILLNLVIVAINLVGLISPMVQSFFSPKHRKSRRKRRYGNDIYELEAKLLTLLQGDRGVAKRLLKHVRLNYPGRDAKWYLEKVIWDLERDRH